MKKNEVFFILEKLKRALKVGTDKELCESLGWKYGTLDTWKNRGKIPKSRLFEVANKLGVDLSFFDVAPKETTEATKSNNTINIPILSIKASAGGGNNIESVDIFKSGDSLAVAKSLFKLPPDVNKLYAIRVDGESMMPRLLPDSWVIFEEANEWVGDGLYVINYNNVLMVKLIEVNPKNGNLFIKSVNPQYSSWEYDPKEDNSSFKIVGKVLRSIV